MLANSILSNALPDCGSWNAIRIKTARVHHAHRRRGGWPLSASAQQPGMPVVGFINSGSADASAPFVGAFRKGLNDAGFVEGQNVRVEYHWLEGKYDQLPALVADLVNRRVALIATPASTPAARAAKAATATIPIVFSVAQDPVQLGLVASLARPGGNATGINFSTGRWRPSGCGSCMTWCPRRFVLPCSSIQPMLRSAEATLQEVQEAAPSIGLQIQILKATTRAEINASFASLASDRPDALFIAGDGFFLDRRVQFAVLTARDRIPAAGAESPFVKAGGLMSYGTDLAETFRQVGDYSGRILKGQKPAGLPVLQSTKFEFVLNLQTAQALNIEVPPAVLSIADEVIE